MMMLIMMLKKIKIMIIYLMNLKLLKGKNKINMNKVKKQIYEKYIYLILSLIKANKNY